MANLLWGKVYYGDTFAGILREESGERASFTYDASYLSSNMLPISYTLPMQEAPHISQSGLHSFFDNLVAEGWLEHAQSRLLEKREASRFEMLLAFGYDCAGAVSVIDPEPSLLSERLLDMNDAKEMAVLTSRASLSGVQPKLAIVKKNKKFIPAKIGELSTYIAKFPSAGHDDLILNEYLTMKAFAALLPRDDVVDIQIGEVSGLPEPALIIKRFDRDGETRIHFEEFNQLLGKRSRAKYDGAHKDMADFLQDVQGGPTTEIYRLCARIFAGLLLGNTDMHLKNFAVFPTKTGFRLTPSYDQVTAVLYQYKTIALSIANARDMPIGSLKAKNMIALGYEFGLSKEAIDMMVKQLDKNREAAKAAIMHAEFGDMGLKNKLIKMMDTRWNGTFALIGQTLSKKP